MPSRPRQRNPSDPKAGLQRRILELLGKKAPLDKVEISKLLDISPAQRHHLRDLLSTMEKDGRIARVRKDRYIIPGEADLMTGVIQFHASGSAHLLAEKPGEPDLAISPENTWTAMHGDRVVARISGESPASGPGQMRKRHGRVIRILERGNQLIVGTFQKSKNFCYVVADDPRFVHNLYVAMPAPPVFPKPGDKVVARLEAWESRHVNPEGSIVEVLGAAGKPGVDMLSIIRKNRLPLEFPPEVIDEAKEISPVIPDSEIKRRLDLRDRTIITIDPDDAKDFDDAIDVQQTEKGWSVGIHIADVSHYVRPKTALDREAYERGNSVYLVDRVIPMLPEVLSNGICSLKPLEDRLCFSALVEITRQGKIHSAKFAKTIIRSAHRYTYKQAYAILQKPPGGDALAKRVHVAWELAALLRKNRFAKGSLDLDFPEIKILLDEKGTPIKLERIENDPSHQLIEEFMLLANECVAHELHQKRTPTVYRVHETPDPERLNEFRELALGHGISIGDLNQRAEVQRLLAKVKGSPEEATIKIGLLKSLKRARYAPDPLGHYGLAKSDYTHFTSPIRRYADLIVHRSLERLLGLTKIGPSSVDIGTIAEHISTTERIAADAEKESVRMKKMEYFQLQMTQKKGQSFRAVIVDVRNFGLFVELPEFLISGLVHISSLDDDFYIHDPAKGRIVGRRLKKVYKVGDELDVVVARVDNFKHQIDFKLARKSPERSISRRRD
ncbi:MAG: ribonuclease R [Chthoniobacterales bacterium]